MIQPPIIGITTSGHAQTSSYCLPSSYAAAVKAAAGIPVLIPPSEPEASEIILQRIDGLIFSGGGDIDPAMYNGVMHPTIYNIDLERDRAEIALAQAALASDIPILGICRGLEVLAVATGGTLIPHLPDEYGEIVTHRAEELLSIQHGVDLNSESRLAQEIIGTTKVDVVSWHHQAVRTVSSEWRVTGWATDGVIEALEHKYHPWAIAVQWHPELSSSVDPLQHRIFQSFITATRQTAMANCEY